MSYLGRVTNKPSDIRVFDVTSSTSATHTLTWTAPNEQSLIVTINGVKQHEDAYSVSGTTLTLTSALVAEDKLEVIGINDIGTTITPAQGSVNTDQLANDAVTSAKIEAGTIATSDIADDAVTTDKLANSINTEIAANTAKVTNATHTGDVTGATALTIADDAVTPAKLADSAYLANRNMIINGDMRIAQRGTAAVDPASNYFAVDRWKSYTQSGSGHTVQQVSDSPAGFEYSIKWTIGTGASPSADHLNIQFQAIEGYNVSHLDFGISSAVSIVASFWVKSSIAGNYGFSIQNSAVNRGYPGQYTINTADTWEYKSVTFTGDTTGTWLKTNGQGMYINWDIGSGTNHEGTLNTWGAGNYKRVAGQVILIATSGATIQFAGAQLEVGTTATPFEHKGIGQEIADCRRYYEKSYVIGTAPGTANQENGVQSIFTSDGMTNGTATRFGGTHYSVEKRGSPTVTIYSREGTSGCISNSALTTLAAGSGTATWIGSSGFIMQMNAASSISPLNGGYVWHWVADAEL